MNYLEQQVGYFDIRDSFVELLGLSNYYAASKIDVGLEYIKRQKTNNALLIGDTKHDNEVAEALNIDCILIPNGHQSKEILLSCGVPVLNGITDVLEYVSES